MADPKADPISRAALFGPLILIGSKITWDIATGQWASLGVTLLLIVAASMLWLRFCGVPKGEELPEETGSRR